MALSWRAGQAVESDRCATIADGLAVRVAIPIAVEWLNDAADAMLEVSEREIAAAVVAFDDAGIRAEPAAAAALAALPHVEADGAVVLDRHRPEHRRRAARPLPQLGRVPFAVTVALQGLSPGQVPTRPGAAGGRCGRGGSRA